MSHRKYRNIQRSDLQTPYSKIFTINFLVYLLQLFMNSVCVYVRENCTTFTIFSPAFFTLYSTQAAHVCSVMIYFAIDTSVSVSPDFLNHWVCSKGGPCFLVLIPKVWFVPQPQGVPPWALHLMKPQVSTWEPGPLGMHVGCFINYYEATLE